jgi:hypothetical protein
VKNLYIIEGGDCTGKTTLSKWIATQRRGGWIHASGGKELHEGMLTYHMSILGAAEHMLDYMDVVLDRFWPSEWCYGRALKRSFNGYDLTKILSRLNKLHCIYVFCSNAGSNDRQLVSKSDHLYDRQEYEAILREYEFLQAAIRGEFKTPLAHLIQEGTTNAQVFTYDFEREGYQMTNFLAQMRNAS